MLSSICFMPASLTPQSLPPGSPTMAMYLSDSTVVTCMRAGLYQTKKGLLAFVFAGLVLRRAVRRGARNHGAGRGQACTVFGINRARGIGEAFDRRVLAG